MRIDTQATICALRNHGEHGAIVRMMTEQYGLQAVYVRGARSRRMRPILIPGNIVQARLAARTDVQLAHAELELLHSRAPLFSEPLPVAAIEWAATLTAAALPEGQPYPRIYATFEGLLSAIEAAPSAIAWGAALVRYELLLLAELGFGLDLQSCAVTGRSDTLTAVSPRSGRAVSTDEAEHYAGKLLALPPFVRSGGAGTWVEIIGGLELSGHFLSRDVLREQSEPLVAARLRLVDRLRRAGGLA